MEYKNKQTLKKEHIEQDIKKEFRYIIFMCIIFIPIFILLLYGGILAIQKRGFFFLTILLLVVTLIILFGFIATLIVSINAYVHRKEKYTIVIDRLVDARWITRHRNRYFYFFFAVQGKIQIIHTKTYYPWSVHYSMIGSSVINSSSFGEDFYLVLVNKKIVSVYNKKMFELSDELTLSPNRKQ